MIAFEPGKLTEELSTHVPDLTALSFKRHAAELGMRPGELLRDLVCELVHGSTYDDLMREHRRQARERLAPNLHQSSDTLAADIPGVVNLGRRHG